MVFSRVQWEVDVHAGEEMGLRYTHRRPRINHHLTVHTTFPNVDSCVRRIEQPQVVEPDSLAAAFFDFLKFLAEFWICWVFESAILIKEASTLVFTYAQSA